MRFSQGIPELRFDNGISSELASGLRYQAFVENLIIGNAKMKSAFKLRRQHRNRNGAAVVEFAVCLPIIIFIVLASIEAASLMFLRQALVQSAYEGAKVAIRNGGNNSDALNAVSQVAAGRRIQNLNVTFTPSDVSSVPQGEIIRVSISAPGDSNSFIPFGPFKGKTISAQAAMVKE